MLEPFSNAKFFYLFFIFKEEEEWEKLSENWI
jgi:hypothetical protein